MSIFDRIIYTHVQNCFNFVHNLFMVPFSVDDLSDYNSKQYFSSRIIAHRGLFGHPILKENTLRAFECAWKVTPHIEFDLRMTQDGHLVIHHDQDLKRLWGVPQKISELRVAELKNQHPEIPTLVELISNWQNYLYEMLPRAEKIQFKPKWFIEIKSEDNIERVSEVLDSIESVWDQLSDICQPIFLSLDGEILRLIRERFPGEDRSFVYMISKKKALDYINEDPQCGLMGWFFNYPKNRGFSEGHHGVGFLDYFSGLNVYHSRNQRIDRPLWIFTNRVDRIK